MICRSTWPAVARLLSTFSPAIVAAYATACTEPMRGPTRGAGVSSPVEAPSVGADAARSSDDAGSAADAGATEDAEAGKPRCGSGAWAMYAHDPARTSASDGCVDGALRVVARFAPKGTCGYRSRPGRPVHAVADGDGVFVSGDCGRAPAVWRVDFPAGESEGKTVWTFSRADYSRASWPAIAKDAIVSTDDGVFFVERETGKRHSRELDVWGEPIVDGDRFFVDNTFQLDSAGPFVGRFDSSLRWVWKANRFDGARKKPIADVGGIALSRDVVVHAAAAGARGVPALSAHDAETGERRWIAKKTWPESAPSIFEGRVHVLERWTGEQNDRLVTRDLSSGEVVWSRKIGWARGTPPPVTPKHVLVHATSALGAFDRATGEPAWSVPLPRTTPQIQSATTVAVALGSGTAVVTSGAKLVVVRLDDGAEVWSDTLVREQGAFIGSPIVVGRTVYVVSRTLAGTGELLKLEPAE